MSAFPWEVLILGLVLAINRVATPATYHRPIAFWGIQAMNVALAVPLAIVGLPGAEGFPALGWLVAALLVFHTLQNVSLRGVVLTKKRQELAEREQFRKLRALEPPANDAPGEAPPEGAPPPEA